MIRRWRVELAPNLFGWGPIGLAAWVLRLERWRTWSVVGVRHHLRVGPVVVSRIDWTNERGRG